MAKQPKTRRPYKSLAEATEAAQSASRERECLHLALYDLVHGRTTWLEESHDASEHEPEAFVIKAGLSRLTGAAGGVVIVTEVSEGEVCYTSAYYLDSWAERVIAGRRANDGPELRALDLLARRALVARSEAYAAETRAISETLGVTS